MSPLECRRRLRRRCWRRWFVYSLSRHELEIKNEMGYRGYSQYSPPRPLTSRPACRGRPRSASANGINLEISPQHKEKRDELALTRASLPRPTTDPKQHKAFRIRLRGLVNCGHYSCGQTFQNKNNFSYISTYAGGFCQPNKDQASQFPLVSALVTRERSRQGHISVTSDVRLYVVCIMASGMPIVTNGLTLSFGPLYKCSPPNQKDRSTS